MLTSATGKNFIFRLSFSQEILHFYCENFEILRRKILIQEWSIASKLRIFRDCAQHAIRNFPKIKIARNTQYATACRQNHAISRNTQHAIRNFQKSEFPSKFKQLFFLLFTDKQIVVQKKTIFEVNLGRGICTNHW